MGMCTKENKNTPGTLGACMYLLCMPQRISMTVEPTCVDYCQYRHGTCFGTVSHSCAMRSEKREKAKHMYYIERVRQCEHIFELHRMRGYGCFSRQPCVLFASMGAAALRYSSCSMWTLQHCGCIYALSYLLFSHQLFLPCSHHNFAISFDVMTVRLLAPPQC